MTKSLYGLLLLITVGFVSCETDIDLNAEYKDITVVYGLINPTLDTHYVKINKAFLGETNALDLAANANNFNYADGEIDITIEEFDGTNVVKTFSTGAGTVVRTINEIPKDQGVFDNSTNVLYRFVESSIDSSHSYKLIIYNKELDKEITAETQIVGNTVVSVPSTTNTYKFKFWNGLVISGNFISTPISVTTGADVGRVRASLIFNYTELYTLSSGKDSVKHSIVMPLGETKTTTSLGFESLEWVLKGETFFENLVAVISTPASVGLTFSHRRLENISLKFDVAGTELSTFMEVNAPSQTVNQDKPNYTNITNGLGVFSSRNKLIWESTINPLTDNQVDINNATISYLESLNLGFCFGTSGTGFPVVPCVQL